MIIILKIYTKTNFGKFSGRPQSVHSSSMCPSSKNSPKRSPSSMASAPAPPYVKPAPVTSTIVRPNSSSEKASKLRYIVHYYLHVSFQSFNLVQLIRKTNTNPEFCNKFFVYLPSEYFYKVKVLNQHHIQYTQKC